MGKKVLAVRRLGSGVRMLPHIYLYLKYKRQLDFDLIKYTKGSIGIKAFIETCTYQHVFRKLFHDRIAHHKSFFINWLLPKEKTLHIGTPILGGGAHFEHSFWTMLNAKKIGKDFYCLHMVTLGKGKDGIPTIGNNVRYIPGHQSSEIYK